MVFGIRGNLDNLYCEYCGSDNFQNTDYYYAETKELRKDCSTWGTEILKCQDCDIELYSFKDLLKLHFLNMELKMEKEENSDLDPNSYYYQTVLYNEDFMKRRFAITNIDDEKLLLELRLVKDERLQPIIQRRLALLQV